MYSTLFMAASLIVQSVLSAVYADKTHSNANALRAQVSMFFIFQLGFIAVGYDYALLSNYFANQLLVCCLG